MFTKYPSFFCHQIADIIELHTHFRYRLRHVLEVFLVFLAILRMVNIIIAAHASITFTAIPQYSWDPSVAIVHRYSHLLKISYLAGGIFWPIHALVLQIFLYFGRVDTVSMQGYYELVVGSMNIYWKCLKPKKDIQRQNEIRAVQIKVMLDDRFCGVFGCFSRINWLISGLGHLWAMLAMEHVNLGKMKRMRLRMYCTLSMKVRLRMIQLMLAIDGCFFLCCLFLALFMPINVLIVTKLVLNHAPIHKYNYLFLFDIFLINAHVWFIFRDTIFGFHYTILNSEVFRAHIAEGNRRLAQIGRSHLTSFDHHHIELAQIYREHTRISNYISIINRDFLSNVAFILLLNTVFNNIFILYRIVFFFRFRLILWNYELNPLEPPRFYIVMGLQIAVMAMILIPMARCNGEMNRAAKYLPRVILELKKSPELKEKLEDLQARLCEGKAMAIGFKIGPGQVVTFQRLMELVLFYVAYLVGIFKFLREHSV